MTRAATKMHTDGGSGRTTLFSADTDTVGKSSHLERTVELKRLRDLALGKVTEVGKDGRLGELEVLFGFDK